MAAVWDVWSDSALGGTTMRSYYDGTETDLLILEVDDTVNSSDAYRDLQHLERVMRSGLRKLVADCQKLKYLSTNGIGMLLLLHKRMTERGGAFVLVNLDGPAADVIRTVRLDRVFHIDASLELARATARGVSTERDNAAEAMDHAHE